VSIKRTGWTSTDELERAIREERAREESMGVRRLRKGQGVFGDYEVETGTGGPRFVAAARQMVPCPVPVESPGHGPDEAGPSQATVKATVHADVYTISDTVSETAPVHSPASMFTFVDGRQRPGGTGTPARPCAEEWHGIRPPLAFQPRMDGRGARPPSTGPADGKLTFMPDYVLVGSLDGTWNSSKKAGGYHAGN
jgi:hypothetical protein